MVLLYSLGLDGESEHTDDAVQVFVFPSDRAAACGHNTHFIILSLKHANDQINYDRTFTDNNNRTV